MWIGANDIDHSDVFTWTDGMPFSYRRWGPGQPDLSPDKLCVAADARSSDIWSTNNCGDEFCFICESYSSTTTTTQQPSTIATSSSSSTTSPSSTITVCTTPPPTISPPFPCQRNIIILFDSSNGMNANQYLNQTAFISYPLFTSSWTFDETNVALAAYDDTDPFNFRITGAFGTINNLKQAQNALHISQYNDAASITTALKMTADPTVFAGATPCVKQATVLFTSTRNFSSNPVLSISLRSDVIVNIPPNNFCMHRVLQKMNEPSTFTGSIACVQKAVVLFTSTSIDADVTTAQQYADGVKKNGPLIIVAMGPNASASKLSSLASPTPVIQWPDYNNVPADLATNIIQAMCSAS
uniref:C-type lectin domain-containing protein n=1 Tax=Plectus sambesii TaxID=2011161 RepID=A0A914UU49_9BILA